MPKGSKRRRKCNRWGGGLHKYNNKRQRVREVKKVIKQRLIENPDGAFYGCEFCRRGFKTEKQVKSFHNQHGKECARWSASAMQGDVCFYYVLYIFFLIQTVP